MRTKSATAVTLAGLLFLLAPLGVSVPENADAPDECGALTPDSQFLRTRITGDLLEPGTDDRADWFGLYISESGKVTAVPFHGTVEFTCDPPQDEPESLTGKAEATITEPGLYGVGVTLGEPDPGARRDVAERDRCHTAGCVDYVLETVAAVLNGSVVRADQPTQAPGGADHGSSVTVTMQRNGSAAGTDGTLSLHVAAATHPSLPANGSLPHNATDDSGVGNPLPSIGPLAALAVIAVAAVAAHRFRL